MSKVMQSNPFKAGDIAYPPYLAGREKQQAQFKTLLTDMSHGDIPAANVVMYGPRGMGKTSLLNWFVDEVEKTAKHNRPLRTVQAPPTISPSLKSLWNKLISDNWKKKLWPNQIELGAGGNKIVWNSKAPDDDDLVSALIEECKERPLVLLMDEAHTMDPAFCQALLNISQQARQNAPFLLVLAGTPGLSHFLSTVGASFVERSKKMGIARLDEQATADAIVKPLNEHDIKINADALEQVVEDSQCYPYFIQLWGEAIWDVAKENNLHLVTGEQISMLQPQIDSSRQNFYSARRGALKGSELLKIAENCALLFQEQEKIKEQDIENVIHASLADNQSSEREERNVLLALARHEFIWQPPDSPLYEAAIPSLMTYVLDKKREQVLLVKNPPDEPDLGR